jgi:hypothetical protein
MALSPSAAASRRFGFQIKPEITPPPIPTNPGTAPASKLFSTVKINLTYAVPIAIDPSGAVKLSQQREYYLNDASTVCTLTVNGAEQPAVTTHITPLRRL